MLRRELASDCEVARELIAEKRVRVGGAIASNPRHMVLPDDQISIEARYRFVSRGGYKLSRALEAFQISAAGRICLDVGASTGGFTDCLLQAGARRVFAVDVGRAQLHSRLIRDERVTIMDSTNARHLGRVMFSEEITLVVGDLSFISLDKVIDALIDVGGLEADYVFLIKPQFEAPRDWVEPGGVIRNADLHELVLARLVTQFSDRQLELTGLVASPIRGRSGNLEFLGHWRVIQGRPARESATTLISEVVRQAHCELVGGL